MLTLNPIEPVLSAWPGMDTLVRRVVLRRPEETVIGSAVFDQIAYKGPIRGRLMGQDLSWYRITTRDARPHEDSAGHLPKPPEQTKRAIDPTKGAGPPALVSPRGAGQPGLMITSATPVEEENDSESPAALFGVADWRDTSRFPTLCRELLEEASGITIPSADFVLKVILAYLIAVVPLNWLICRFVLNRREWAWVVVPLVALGFAIAVQRVAAYDVGFDSASDEIDVLEIQGEYHRAHLSRFASLYTNGRGNYSISYPNNNSALTLPLDNGRSIRGEDVTTSIWQSSPVPELMGLAVQPRSMSLFRSEELATLGGSIRIEGEGAKRRLVNESELELRDATLIDFVKGGERREQYLGTIAAGSSADMTVPTSTPPPDRVEFAEGPDPNTILRAVRTTWERREENIGEIRMVAWVPRAMPGQVIDPPVDRARGFTAVLVHLRSGPPPSPDGPTYNLLALGPEKAPAAAQKPGVEVGTPTIFSGRPRRPPQTKRGP